MRKKAIVIDLDNTIIDTAIRKHAILKKFLPQQTISEKKVREDFDLVTVLGQNNTEASSSFFSKLDSVAGIQDYPAPIFLGVSEFLDKYTKKGISIILITGRPETLRDATIKELKTHRIDSYISELYMYEPKHLSIGNFKKGQINSLLQKYDIIVSIGDRPDDLESAKEHNLPFLLIRTTLQSEIILDKNSIQMTGGSICSSWAEIDAATDTIIEGRIELANLRKAFTESYASVVSHK